MTMTIDGRFYTDDDLELVGEVVHVAGKIIEAGTPIQPEDDRQALQAVGRRVGILAKAILAELRN